MCQRGHGLTSLRRSKASGRTIAATKVKRLLDQNEKLVASVTGAKSALAEEMARARRDVKAVNHYLSVGA